MKHICYIFSLALLSLVSCTDERDYGVAEIPQDGKTVEFTLNSSSPTAEVTRATRAIDDLVAHEDTITRLDVFFFDETGAERVFYPSDSQFTIDKQTGKVTITIPEQTYDGYMLDQECIVYVMANCHIDRNTLAAATTLANLKNLTLANGTGRSFNLTDAPADFFMTGETSVTFLRDKRQDLGRITLKRAAAKIVVDISNAEVSGYTPGEEVRVRLTNYLDKTKLDSLYQYTAAEGSDDYQTRTKTLSSSAGTFSYIMDTENSFYTYSNDWNTDAGRETYITLEVDWTKNDDPDAEAKTYYYRIPFSYIDAGENAAAHKNRINRNFVYQFMVDVSKLGGLNPEDAVVLDANFDVIDWTLRTVDVSILSYHYLFVYNSRVEIHQANTYEWEYKSSLPIEFSDVKAYCTEYINRGEDTREVNYPQGTPQYPVREQRVGEDGKTYFRFTSSIPINYVPLYITAKVYNDAQLFSNVSLTIYPEQYVTASHSEGHQTTKYYPQAGAYGRSLTNDNDGDWGDNYGGIGPGGTINYNFYTVTTTSLRNQTILINGVRQLMVIGDPTRLEDDHPFPNIYGYYQTDPTMNHMISPQFVVASRRGATSLDLTWNDAFERCKRYRESQYPAATWRVPTYAELALLSVMQNDGNSAIKDLFSTSSGASNWWTALQAYRMVVNSYDNYDETVGSGGILQGGTGPVRCVHDTWRD